MFFRVGLKVHLRCRVECGVWGVLAPPERALDAKGSTLHLKLFSKKLVASTLHLYPKPQPYTSILKCRVEHSGAASTASSIEV